MDGEFLKIKCSEFELDPGSNSGQPSVWRITHSVFFLGIGKYTFNGLRAQSIGFFADRRMADILRPFDVLLPDMPGDGLYALLTLGALFSHRTVPADIALAFVFPVAFTVGGRIIQGFVLGTDHAVIVLVVYVFVPRKIAFLRHWAFVGQRRQAPAVYDLFADPRRLYPASAVTTSISG